MYDAWLALTLRTMRLGFEAQQVIALRMMRIAAGGARAQDEVRRMVVEKGAALAEAQAAMAAAVVTGRKDTVIAGKALQVMKKHVGGNRRRLSRK
jgi:hypothetical protein